MASTSEKTGRYDPSDGLFRADDDDAALFGSGTIAARPATGNDDGDIYLVQDQALQIFRVDRWSSVNAAWMIDLNRSTSDPGPNDDQTVGYHIGSAWVNTTRGTIFFCISASATVARWVSHKTMRDLAHFVESGPADGFASGAYEEILPDGDPFPTSDIWYESAAKAKKIVSLDTTYNANKTINTEVWKTYDIDGITPLVTMTDTYGYSGIFVSSVARTWS